MPNLLIDRTDICSLTQGEAVLTTRTPNGVITPQDAQDIIDWLDILLRRLRRQAQTAPTKDA